MNFRLHYNNVPSNDNIMIRSLESMKRLLLVLLLGVVMAAPVLVLQTAVGEKNGKDVDSLIKDLKDENSTIRADAAKTLGEINDTKAVYPLIQALKDDNESVRAEAATSLGNTKDDQAVYPLIQALTDRKPVVRFEIANALVEIGKSAVEPLIQALKDKKENSSVREYAASALGEINDTRAVDPLIQALNDDDSGVRWNSAYALGTIGDVRAVQPLIRALKDNDSIVRGFAGIALEKINVSKQAANLIDVGESKSQTIGPEGDVVENK